MTNFDPSSVRLPIVIIAYALATNPWSIANADPPATNASSSESAAEESLEVRYARAQLELAELDLRRAQEWNKRIPHFYSVRTMDYLRKHVEIDSEQLEQSLVRNQLLELHIKFEKSARR